MKKANPKYSASRTGRDLISVKFNSGAMNVIKSKKITLVINDDHLIIRMPDIDTKNTRTISAISSGHGVMTLGNTWATDIIGEYVFNEIEGDNIYFNKI